MVAISRKKPGARAEVVLCVLFCITVIVPFLYILALSFNNGTDALKGGIGLVPREFTLENYAIIFQEENLLKAVGVSVARTVIGTVSSGIRICSLLFYEEKFGGA